MLRGVRQRLGPSGIVESLIRDSSWERLVRGDGELQHISKIVCCDSNVKSARTIILGSAIRFGSTDQSLEATSGSAAR